jgi:acetate kinase
MATRPGSVDPGALLYLLRHQLTLDELDRTLEHQSGLLGLSGLSADVRELKRSDDPAVRLALQIFAYRVARAVGSLAVPLGGLDALVFTAGIGEHSAGVRADVCAPHPSLSSGSSSIQTETNTRSLTPRSHAREVRFGSSSCVPARTSSLRGRRASSSAASTKRRPPGRRVAAAKP